jgi:hypothetical protein
VPFQLMAVQFWPMLEHKVFCETTRTAPSFVFLQA